ncbi:Iron-sulfur cluster insertion protein ErpA [Planctomycetales bacterium 10988]|nr:Iron-sulfur cluster insertion protein ErpA [Planctomycetales bacterium 10988]
MAVTLTERAAKEFVQFLKEQELGDEYGLRLGILTGGCSGYQYQIAPDDNVDDTMDKVYDCHGVKLIVDKKSGLYLDGTTVDFEEHLHGRGFTFSNPNATKTCGCGHSFHA